MPAPFRRAARAGAACAVFSCAGVKTTGGKVLYKRGEGGFGRVIEPGAVAAMNLMMRDTFAIGTAKKGEIPGWETAGKTGTSQDFRDAWFVGYTGSLVAGVWFGNDDGEPTKRVSGGNLPVETWNRFMRTALQGAQPVGLPGLGRRPAGDAVAASPRLPGQEWPGQAGGPARSTESAWAPPSAQDRGLLSRLFGN